MHGLSLRSYVPPTLGATYTAHRDPSDHHNHLRFKAGSLGLNFFFKGYIKIAYEIQTENPEFSADYANLFAVLAAPHKSEKLTLCLVFYPQNLKYFPLCAFCFFSK